MSNLSVQQQQQLSIYLKKNPKVSREKAIKLLFGGGAKASSDKGLAVEHKKNSAQAQTIYLQSGRKVVYTRLKNGGLACKYYGADGTQLKPEYFKKVEGNISISANGTSYTITKNGKKSKSIKAKDARLGVIDQNIVKLNNQEKRLKKTQKEQGFIGKGWDWFKNKTGIGDSSDKAQTQIDAERKLLVQMRKSGAKISKSEFEKITGQKCTPANMKKFQQGDFSQAAKKVSGYQEGQEMAVDVVADVASGVVAFGIYTAAVASSPFTGGTSIALGVFAAAGTGALIKSGIKAADAFSGGRKYTFDNFKKDAGTGAVSGMLAPVTSGFGGAVGKVVATKLGLQTVKTVGKEIAEEVVENSFKQTLKTSLQNPGAFKFVGEGSGKKILAYGSEVLADGVINGGIDNGFRTAVNGGSLSDIAKASGEGALFAPLVGLGMKGTGFTLGKATSLVNKTVKENGFHYIKTPFGNKDFKLTQGQYTRLKLENNSTMVLRSKTQNPTNLTNELKKGIYQLSDVHALLRNNPNLGRTVGKLPSKWGKAVKSSEAFKKIDDAFSSYAKDFHEGKASKEGLKNLETKLATILNTDVKVAYLGSGSIGSTYKISALGQDYVYKVFYKEGMFSSNQGHGNSAELLSAVRASRLSPKNFAKFYMGKFGEKEDGYILTKFIPETTKTTNNKGYFSNFLKGMSSADNHSDNVRNGVILDYGAAKVWSYSALSPKGRKIAREVFSAIDANSTENIGKIIKKYASNKEFDEVKNLLLQIRDDNFLSNSEVFAKRSKVFSMLGIDYKVDIRKMAGVDPEPYAKYYGLSEKEMWHLENLANARRNEKYKVNNGKKSVTQGKDAIENKRVQLKQEIARGNKISLGGDGISIPKGKLKAPSSKFAETDDAFAAMINKNKYKILQMQAEYRVTGNKKEYLINLYKFICKEMDIENVSLKLINDEDIRYGGAFIPASKTVELNMNYNGDSVEVITHELNHYLQFKEQLITGNGVEVVANNDAVRLLKEEVRTGEIKTQAEANQFYNSLYKIGKEGYSNDYSDVLNGTKYPKNTNPNDYYFKKANQYNQADLDYEDACVNYEIYENNLKEVESKRRGILSAKLINESPEKQVINSILENIPNADAPTKLALIDLAIEEMQKDIYRNYTADQFVVEFFRKYVSFN